MDSPYKTGPKKHIIRIFVNSDMETALIIQIRKVFDSHFTLLFYL